MTDGVFIGQVIRYHKNHDIQIKVFTQKAGKNAKEEMQMSKYVIVDLEMCKVPKPMRSERYHRGSETIQIGAVLVDENLQITDEFSLYVHPEYGSINGFIRNLTGITSFDVKDACTMREALERFVDWIPEDAICVSWSNSDENQIRYEAEAKGIKLPRLERLLDSWEDCQKTFADKIGETRKYRLSEALIAADIAFDEHLHNGLTDARNTALLFIKMKKEPVLVLNPYYQKGREEEERVEMYSLASLCPALRLVLA